MSEPTSLEQPVQRDKRALWVQSVCVTLVCIGAAYASYRHGRDFASRYGADDTTAALWPLIVDGLMTTATVELWKTSPENKSGRFSAWLAFLVGVTLSLCANFAAAPELSVFAITVAVCPPLALLLSVELLNSALKRHRAQRVNAAMDRLSPTKNVGPDVSSRPDKNSTAEQRMWCYYKTEQAKGNTPTGADLDRFAGTNNYGRRVIHNWRSTGRIAENGKPQGEAA